MSYWNEVVAETMLSASYYESTRWKRNPRPILLGESEGLLNRSGFKAYPEHVEAVAALLPIVAKNPELFTVSAARSRYSSGLGQALYVRTKGMSNQDSTANTTLKSWFNASSRDFSKLYLPKALGFAAKRGGVKIQLPSLLVTLADWDRNVDLIARTISAEYFSIQQKEETK